MKIHLLRGIRSKKDIVRYYLAKQQSFLSRRDGFNPKCSSGNEQISHLNYQFIKSHLFGELARLVRAGHDLVVEDREVEGKAQPGKRCELLTKLLGISVNLRCCGSGAVSI